MKYIDADGTEKTADATAIDTSTSQLSEGWYYVSNSVNVAQIEGSGEVHHLTGWLTFIAVAA